jgi:GDPmannose 4,6-dehydratase
VKRAVITGITGQDAAYLAKLLLDKDYEVYGTHRACSSRDFWRIEELGIANTPNLHMVEFQAVDLQSCKQLLEFTRADEIYNLAGQTSAVTAVTEPLSTAKANGMAVIFLLEAVRLYLPSARFFQAGSSELFGEATQVPQVESTPFYPSNSYGVAKLFAHWAVINYREAYGIFAANGILFNHESPLRGKEFVTRKITDALAKIKLGLLDCVGLGNMNAKRDWGYAKDFVAGMWATLRAERSDSYIFATNQQHTVREFVTMAASAAGFDLEWEGTAKTEVGRDRKTGKVVVRVNPEFYRALEIHERVGNPARALEKLGWSPTTTLEELCRIMVEADLRRNALIT